MFHPARTPTSSSSQAFYIVLLLYFEVCHYMSLNDTMTVNQNGENVTVIKSWKTDSEQNSIIFCIPRKIAIKYDIDKPAHLCLFEQDNGILLKKLELAK